MKNKIETQDYEFEQAVRQQLVGAMKRDVKNISHIHRANLYDEQITRIAERIVHTIEYEFLDVIMKTSLGRISVIEDEASIDEEILAEKELKDIRDSKLPDDYIRGYTL